MAKAPYQKSTPKSYNHKNFVTLTNVGGDTVTAVDTSSEVKWTSMLDGETNTLWKAQVDAGQNATTYLDAWDRSRSYVKWQAREWWNYEAQTDTPNPLWTREIVTDSDTASDGYSNNPLGLSMGTADNLAKADHVRRIKRKQTTIQGATVIAEGARALQLLRNPLRAAREGFGNYFSRLIKGGRSLKPLSVRRKKELLADSWLEFQFGWKPLVNDIDDAMRALADHHYRQPRAWETVLSTGEDVQFLHRIKDYTFQAPTGPFLRCDRVTTTRVIVVYESQVDIGTYVADNVRLGLTLSDLPSAAWEIVPWSFLIDYFTNTGDIIAALSLNTSNVRWTRKTVVKMYHTRYEGVHAATSSVPNPWGGYPSVTGGPLNIPPFISKHVHRTPYTGSFVPTAEFSIPGMGTKWLNIAALWAGRRNLRSLYLTRN